jgi:hypothetical protein
MGINARIVLGQAAVVVASLLIPGRRQQGLITGQPGRSRPTGRLAHR